MVDWVVLVSVVVGGIRISLCLRLALLASLSAQSTGLDPMSSSNRNSSRNSKIHLFYLIKNIDPY
jgi:hypothetical protein